MKEKMDFYEFQKALRDGTQHWVDKANEMFDLDLSVRVVFNLKGTTAGRAFSRKNPLVVDYNLAAYNIEGGIEHLINNTVPHEVAHIVQYNNPKWPQDRNLNKPHGQYWKLVMSRFGVPADRCHSLPLPKARRTTTFTYACVCRKHELSKIRHNKIRRGIATYTCRNCKSPLAYYDKFTQV